MREFPEPDSDHEVDPSSSSSALLSSAEAGRGGGGGSRKRHRPHPNPSSNCYENNGSIGGNGHENDDLDENSHVDDAWFAEESMMGEMTDEGWKEAPFSPVQLKLATAKSAATAAAKMTEAQARNAIDTNGNGTPECRAAQPPDRKRARSRQSAPSPAAAAAAAATSVVGTPASSSFRRSRLPSQNAFPPPGDGSRRGMVRGVGVSRPTEGPRATIDDDDATNANAGDSGRKQHQHHHSRARDGRNRRPVPNSSSNNSCTTTSRLGGEMGGEDCLTDGDASGGGGGGGRFLKASRDGVSSDVLRGAAVTVAVTPQDSNLPPPDPSSMRECLDEYMEVRLDDNERERRREEGGKGRKRWLY